MSENTLRVEETTEEKTVFVTTDFEAWKSSMLKHRANDQMAVEKNIYPDALKELDVKYMLSPVAMYNGNMLMATQYKTEGLTNAINYITKLLSQYDVFVYAVEWIYTKVEEYVINDIIVRFGTLPKTKE